jgi:hypothetical protein
MNFSPSAFYMPVVILNSGFLSVVFKFESVLKILIVTNTEMCGMPSAILVL